MKTIRRLYVYLVTLISLEVVVWALITLARSIFEEGFTLAADSLAGGLAFILVGLPVFFFHWWLAQRDAQQDEDEGYSGVRTFFLYATWIALAVPVVHSLLSILMRALALTLNLGEIGLAFGTDQSWSDNLIAIVVNGVLAAYFRRVILQHWQKPQGESLSLMRRVNRYFWMLYGFVMMYGGAVLLMLFITEDIDGGVDAAMVNGISFALIGAGVWVYSWRIIKNAIKDPIERSSWIRLSILYALSLLGALATLFPAGVILGVLLNGIFGETAVWSNFLLEISVAFSVLIPSAVVWGYFRQTLWQDTESLPQISEGAGRRRVYYYVLSLAGLIATFAALQLLAMWLIDMFVPPQELWGSYPREGLANTLATLLVGLPVWTFHWRPVQVEILKDDEQADHASRSLVRKGYLYLILFAGVIGTMIAAGMLLYQVIQLVLGNPDRHSLQTILEQGALLILFVVFSIYHWRCLQSDGRRVSKALTEKYTAYPVVVFETGEGQFSEGVLNALKAIAPSMPAVVQPVGDPFDERIDSAAVAVIPSNLLTHPPEDARVWLEGFTGSRLVIPIDEKDWIWAGLTDLSSQELARQAAKMITQFAEVRDTRQRRMHSPLTIIGYVLGALVGAALLCIASTVILEMF